MAARAGRRHPRRWERSRGTSRGDGLLPCRTRRAGCLAVDAPARNAGSQVRSDPFAVARWLSRTTARLRQTQLDDAIRKVALEAGVTPVEGLRATDVDRDERGRVIAVVFTDAEKPTRIHCNRLIVADGVRSQQGECSAANARSTATSRRSRLHLFWPQRRPVDLQPPRTSRHPE